MFEAQRLNDVGFEDVSDDVLFMEDSLIVLEPFGSFPVGDFRKTSAQKNFKMMGGEV